MAAVEWLDKVGVSRLMHKGVVVVKNALINPCTEGLW